jgi:hypothetical protein
MNAAIRMRHNRHSRLCRAAKVGAVIILLAVAALPLLGQNSGIQYFCDDLGQLIRAVDQSRNVATCAYAAQSGATNTYLNNGVPMDPNYPNLPASNVANITQGYNDEQSGTLCTPSN